MKANLIPAILTALAAFILFRRLYLVSKTVTVRIILILAGMVLAIPSVLFVSNYMLLIPCADWFVELHSLPGAEITSGLAGALLGVMYASSRLRPGKLNLPILAFFTIFTAGLVITPFAKQVCYGMNYSYLGNRRQDGICLQTSPYTCVPASAATIIRMLGDNVTERELAQAAGTTSRGTEVWYLTRALRKRGYEPDFGIVKSLRQAPVPSVVGVKLGSIGHVVVLLEKNDKGVVIGEPLRGRHEYNWKTFQRLYRPTGTYITIERVRERQECPVDGLHLRSPRRTDASLAYGPEGEAEV